MRLSGLLGKPGVSRGTRQDLVTVVNGRPVDSRHDGLRADGKLSYADPEGSLPAGVHIS
ncbi:DNA mismatch repair protein MutL [Opitutia bacterium]|nr:DNA mismatch repair protein MutL [Opitutae bacterium]